ncbi:trypsin-like serine peptidase [Pseudoprimorskyibacter insulae]|uniref:Serine protease n=1 Tax=Pseudoprimorskyibacter insulae TaxID=1695997 RepID=A0A2R8AXW7_9RHOB|nr:trypsin-like serine protease [Pseudoprimorskyibacter insulae]SPF80881.1 hypothetical protein PRI8871_02694 [Pseudoprimorskyibacter insulae]
MTRLLALLLALAGPAFADPLPPLDPEARGEWLAVGRVNIAGYSQTGMCTGTLIAPDLVLTAAHCVMRGGAMARLSDLHFVAGWFGGRYAGHGLVREVTLHPEAGDPPRLPYDLALIHLAAPLDIAPLPVAAPADGPCAIVGYFDLRPNRLSARFDCAGMAARGGWQITCPTRWGNSGGPILQRGPDGWQVIAVVSEGNTTFTVGALAAEFVNR